MSRIAAGKKRCKKCGRAKLYEDFHLDPKNLDGRAARCADCVAIARGRVLKKEPIMKVKDPNLTSEIKTRAVLNLIKNHRAEFDRLLNESKKILDPT